MELEKRNYLKKQVELQGKEIFYTKNNDIKPNKEAISNSNSVFLILLIKREIWPHIEYINIIN